MKSLKLVLNDDRLLIEVFDENPEVLFRCACENRDEYERWKAFWLEEISLS